jgi:DNA-binding response OmpR family regulator
LPSDIQRGLDAGANKYITKPVAFQEFSAAVLDVISKTEMLGN